MPSRLFEGKNNVKIKVVLGNTKQVSSTAKSSSSGESWESPIVFAETRFPKKGDSSIFSLFEKHGFQRAGTVDNNDYGFLWLWKDAGGQEYISKHPGDIEALAYHLARLVGFPDISEVFLAILPDDFNVSKLEAMALISYYDGITFSTRKPAVRGFTDSELYRQHPELRDISLEGIDLDAWINALADPAQIVRSDLFRVFVCNPDSEEPSNLLYKYIGRKKQKLEIRYIDYELSFDALDMPRDKRIVHLEKYADYYSRYCPQLLLSIADLSDEEIEKLIRWVYRDELIAVRVGIAKPEKLIANIKDSRDLIKDVLSDEIAKIRAGDPAAKKNSSAGQELDSEYRKLLATASAA